MGTWRVGIFSRDKACPASFSHLCNLPFPPFQPQSRFLHALPAPPHRFLPNHLIYGVIDDGYGVTGGWLSSVGHGWAQRGAGSVPEAGTVGRVTAGSGFLFSRWWMPVLHLCVHMCVCVLCQFVCWCIRTPAGGQGHTDWSRDSVVLRFQLPHTRSAPAGCLCREPPQVTRGWLCSAGCAPRLVVFSSYAVLQGCRQSYPLSPQPFSGLKQGTAVPPLSARLLRLLSCRAAVKEHTTSPSSGSRDRSSFPCPCHSGLAKGTGEPHLRFPLSL